MGLARPERVAPSHRSSSLSHPHYQSSCHSSTDEAPTAPSPIDVGIVAPPERDEYLAKILCEKRKRARQAARERVRPVLWGRIASEHTKTTLFVVIAIGLMLGIIGLFVGQGGLYETFKGIVVFFRREDWLVDKDGWEMGWRRAKEEVMGHGLGTVIGGAVENSDAGFNVVFESVAAYGKKEGNMLTRENLAKVKKIEDEFMKRMDYKEFCYHNATFVSCDHKRPKCALPLSITRHPMLYGVYDGNNKDHFCGMRKGSEPVSKEQFINFLESKLSADSFYALLLSEEFDGRRAPVILSRFPTGLPLRTPPVNVTFRNPYDHEKAQAKLLRRLLREAAAYLWNSSERESIKVHVAGKLHEEVSFWSAVKFDIIWIILALAVTALTVWIYTNSLLLTVFGSLQVFLAVPVAYCFYRFVFQIHFTSGFHIICIFALLPISIIDIFLFTDAWQQAAVVLGSDCDITIRMSWTYCRVAKANLMTSIPTAIAFFAAAFHPTMALSSLAIWTGAMTVVHYVFSVTMYPCAIVIWHTFWRQRKWSRCLRYDYNFNDPDPFSSRSEQVGDQSRCYSRRSRELSDPCHGAAELFFRNTWTPFLNQVRYIALVGALGLIGTFGYFTSQLRSLEHPEKFLLSRNQLQQDIDLTRSAFVPEATRTQLKVSIVHGVKGIDRQGVWRYDSEQRGTPIFDESFDLRSAMALKRLVDICDDVEKDSELNIDKNQPSKCWPRDFLKWYRKKRKRKDFEDYRSHVELIKDIREFANFTEDNITRPHSWVLLTGSVGLTFHPDRVVSSRLEFFTKISEDESSSELDPLYRKWKKKVDALNKISELGLSKANVSGGDAWEWMHRRHELKRRVMISFGISLGAVFVALMLSMLNILMASYVLSNVGSIAICAVGLMHLMSDRMNGGKGGVGIAESLIIVLITGLSVKNTTLVGHAYLESETKGNRFLRTRDALTYNGFTIVSSSVAVIISTAFLLGTQILPLFKYGVMIICTTVLSAIWSLFFFPSLLLTVGPEDNYGSIVAFVKGSIIQPVKRWWNGEAKEEKEEEDGQRYVPFRFENVIDVTARNSCASSWMVRSSGASSVYQPFVFNDAYGCDEVASIRHILSKQSNV